MAVSEKMRNAKYDNGMPMYITETRAKDPTEALLGKTPDSKNVTHCLSAMPHLLVAGTTGSGKSVSMNGMIISMMTHATPKQLKIAAVDPKKVEFSAYKGCPYMLADPITDMEEAGKFMVYLTIVMDDRYEKLSEAGVKNIDEYNNWASENGEETWPYIVCVVDEYSDLKMQNKDVEDPIIRLAQKARAAGIHMILATQTPRATVVTGVIKANFPGRMALMVSGVTESQIILDEAGAEKLKPHGDTLANFGDGKLKRFQAPYISNDEIKSILEYMRETYPAPEYEDYLSIVEKHEEEKSSKKFSSRSGGSIGYSRSSGGPGRPGAPRPKKTAGATTAEEKEKIGMKRQAHDEVAEKERRERRKKLIKESAQSSEFPSDILSQSERPSQQPDAEVHETKERVEEMSEKEVKQAEKEKPIKDEKTEKETESEQVEETEVDEDELTESQSELFMDMLMEDE